MKLKTSTIETRDFLIQFNDILGEFWREIPRLEKISNTKYITNVDAFKQQMFQLLELEPTAKITPYMLTTDDKNEEYIWGLLHFSSSPEKFKDKNNEIIKKQLASENYSYLTCLQIRDAFRGGNHGVELFSKSVEKILKEFHRFRWVVSDEKLLPYYQYFGAEIINNMDNKDHAALIIGDEKSFIKRH